MVSYSFERMTVFPQGTLKGQRFTNVSCPRTYHGKKDRTPLILKFENIFRLKVALFVYKFKNDKSNTPAVLLNILIPASDIHSYNTRYVANQNFFKPSVSTNYGVSTFKFSATKIWESVPLEFKRFPYMLFKKKYKRFLLSTQLTID